MSKHERGPADAGNDAKHVSARNSSTSHKAGANIIKDAMRGTEGRDMHIGGGCKDPGGDEKPPREDGGVRDELSY